MLNAITSNPQVMAQLHALAHDVFQLVGSLVGIIIVLAGKALIASRNSGLQKIIAARLVAYAEQKLEDSSNGEKAQFVAQKLQEKFPKLPADEVAHLLEEAVLNVKTQLAQAQQPIVVPVAAAQITQEVKPS